MSTVAGIFVIMFICIAGNLDVLADESVIKAINDYKTLCPFNFLCYSPASQSSPVTMDNFTSPGSCCRPCSCLEDCGIECCPDKPVNYLTDEEIRLINEESTVCLRPQFKAVDADSRLQNGAFKMVVSCPKEVKNATLRAKCGRDYNQFDLSEDLSYLGPVSNATTIFKNKYCAICNGVNEQDIEIWGVKIICHQPATFPDVRTTKEIIDAVNNNTKCDLFFSPANFTHFRSKTCSPQIRRCNVTGLWQEFDAEIERACLSYTSLFRKEYKNVHCYLCNSGSNVEVPTICESLPGGYTPNSFVALLDFRGLEETPKSEKPIGSNLCPYGYHYDPIRKECRLLSCPEYMIMKDDECQSIFQKLEGFNKMTYYITISIEPNHRINNLAVNPLFMEELYDALKSHVNNIFEDINSELTLCDVYGFMILRKNISAILDEFSRNEDSYFAYSYIKYFAIKMEVGGHILSNFDGQLNTIENMFENYQQDPTLRQYKIRFRNIALRLFEESIEAHKNYRDYGNPELDFLLNTLVSSYQLRKSLGSTFFEKTTELVIAPLHRSSSDYCGAVAHFQVQSSCPKVELNVDEFQATVNGIYVNKTNSSLSNNEVTFTIHDTVLICFKTYFAALNFSEQITYTYLYKNQTSPITIVTVVVLALSVALLVITLIVYTLFKQLRSLPGLNIIALVTSLLVSHLLTLLNGVVKINIGEICIAFGITLHLSLLISVFWMFVCTYHMAKVFIRMKTMHPETTNKCQKFFGYTCFTVVTSALFVVANIVTSVVRSQGRSVGYDEFKCYLDSSDMILFTVAIPTGFVVVSNIVMFLCVMIKLSRVPSLRDCSNNERNNLKIFAKLSTLTGATYCFGFLYQFTEIEAFSYIFIICNASQGVFIMFAFVTNKRVAAMLKSFFKEQRNSSIKKTILQQSITSERNSKKMSEQSKM